MKLSKKSIEDIRETIKHTGELRLHIQWSKSGLTTKCRLWHPDGYIVGSADGGGYDKEGAAVGEAIMLLFAPELAALPDEQCGYVRTTDEGEGTHEIRNKVGYGISRYREVGAKTRTYVEGASGIDQMLSVLRVLGFSNVEKYSTSKASNMLLARR